jgi:hypothetical protein
MAVAVATDPKAFPCETCRCRNGVSEFDRWKVPDMVPGTFAIEPTNRCFRQLVTPAAWHFLELYKHYKNGLLPLAGGLLEQPAIYYKAMTIIDEWHVRSTR